MKKLRVSSGINLHSFPKENIEEYIRQGLLFQKEIGFDEADFPMGLLKLMENPESGIESAKEIAQQIGIRFELCHLPFGINMYSAPEDVIRFNESVHQAIDAAKALGVDYAVVHPNTVTIPEEEFDYKKQHDAVIEHLTPFAEHAAKIGLNIVVENMRLVPQGKPVHRYCGTPEELCEIADALGIGVCWDTGHAHINGLVQSEALAYVGSRLKMLHINDNFAGDDIHLAPFCGTVDWSDVMQGLAKVGFCGLLNYEISTARQPAATRKAFARYLYDAAQELLNRMQEE